MHKNRKAILDTHIFVWLMLKDKELNKTDVKLIDEFAQNGSLYISSITLWEIAMLDKKSRLNLHQPCALWLDRAIKAPGLSIENITTSIAIESVNLPGDFHQDPADRLIVATARCLNAVLLTRDRKIIEYSNLKHLDCIHM